MPSPSSVDPGKEDLSLNLRLWSGVLLPPAAGGINVVVGYMVSNYSCTVHNRRMVLLVNLLCLLVCVSAAMLVYGLRTRIETESDDVSPDLRAARKFLRTLALWAAAGFALLVVAGTVSTLTLGACDL